MSEMGHPMSPETREKMSRIMQGNKYGTNPSPEVRAKMSAAHKGKKLAGRSYGMRICVECGEEFGAVNSNQKYCTVCGPIMARQRKMRSHAANKEKENAQSRKWNHAHPEKRRESSHRFAKNHPDKVRGWLKDWIAANPERISAMYQRHDAKRRTLGFLPMNTWFDGCEGHHINDHDVIYIPKKIHRSVIHNLSTGKGMVEINAKACAWMTEDWT